LTFPCLPYAEAALNSLQVDPPFQDTKTKKSSILRSMNIKSLEGEWVNLEIEFSSNEEEASSLRTCISSFVTNMTMICETMRVFGNWMEVNGDVDN
jgi:hypothetical protein